jgi:hypothetical protein
VWHAFEYEALVKDGVVVVLYVLRLSDELVILHRVGV